MTDVASPSAHDPRPQPPDKPLPMECCESGCLVCVYDIYTTELEEYREALAAWLERNPGRE